MNTNTKQKSTISTEQASITIKFGSAVDRPESIRLEQVKFTFSTNDQGVISGNPQVGSGKNTFPWSDRDRGVKALCLLLVKAVVGQNLLSGPEAQPLAESAAKGGKGHWPGQMLCGDYQKSWLLPRLVRGVLGNARKKVPYEASLLTTILPRERIEIYVGSDLISDSGQDEKQKKLQQLHDGLALLLRVAPGPSVKRAVSPTQVGPTPAAIGKLLEGKYGLEFLVAADAAELPERAARFLREQIRARLNNNGRVVVGLSGGCVQLEMVEELEAIDSDLRSGKHHPPSLDVEAVSGSVTFCSLNKMAWPDGRMRRSADFLAIRLSEVYADKPVVSVPVSDDFELKMREFENAVDEADVIFLSGGARSGSFVMQLLSLCHKQVDPTAVGDINGHLVDAKGREVGSKRSRDLIQRSIRCFPSIAKLRSMAKDANRKVVLLLNESSYGVADPSRVVPSLSSKLDLARACLHGKLTNTFILPMALARHL